jgi:hypothetical protein
MNIVPKMTGEREVSQNKKYLNELNLRELNDRKFSTFNTVQLNDETQSCLNVKINTDPTKYSETKLHLLNQQRIENRINKMLSKQNSFQMGGHGLQPSVEQSSYQKSLHLSYLVTPRLQKRPNLNYERLNQQAYTPLEFLQTRKHEPVEASNSNLSNYLTWKSFNCNPLPKPIETDNSGEEKHGKMEEINFLPIKTKSRQGFDGALKNLDLLCNPGNAQNTNLQNGFQNRTNERAMSFSTPSTPLLSSLTAQR